MSYPMHRNKAMFKTGILQEPQPLSVFWAERFLVSTTEGGIALSLKDCEGAWVPYGGGSNECPGRFYAKQETLLTAALLIGTLEVELQHNSAQIEWRYFGTGVLGVKSKQPFRLRRRQRP